ncbi:MAG: CapA family protein [Bacilli bacterium]|nr:CapA family protein [Bacilli bacterium]
MTKRKSRRLKRKIRNFLLIIVLMLISVVGGWYLQRKDNTSTSKVEIEYKVINTKKEYNTNLVMVGDALIHGIVYETAHKYANYNGYDFRPMLKYTKEIVKDYDLAYYNQETILGGVELGLATYPQFNSPYEVGDAFIDAGFNLVSLATNHTMDNYQRTSGKTIENSVNYWKNHSEEILAAGSYSSFDERDEVRIKEIKGIKYGFLSYTTYTNGLIVPTGKEYLVNVYDKALIKEEVERYRDKVDLLMVAMHWGTEYMTYPTSEQKEIAKYLSSLGVDLIIGCHPHVIEPIEYIGDTLVIYSLGNFVSSQVGVERLTGLMASLDIKKTEYHGKSTIEFDNITGTLLFTDRNNGYIVYPYHLLNDNILSGYKSYYEKYSKVVTAYSDKVTVRGLDG